MMSRGKRGETWRAEPLARGRHKLSVGQVRSSQRERLLKAMETLVGERGYAATTVPAVIAAARVSRDAFYALFADKEACFIALCDQQPSDFIQALVASSVNKTWFEAVRLGLRTYLHWWQERPEFTRAYFVEMPTAGVRAIEQRLRAYLPFEKMLRRAAAAARRAQPGLPPLRPAVPRLLVIATTEYLAAEVFAGRGDSLLGLEEDLLYLHITLLSDDATARRVLSPVDGRSDKVLLLK